MSKAKNKYKLLKRFIESGYSEDYRQYAKERNELRKLTRQLNRNFKMDLASNLKGNPKAF